MPHRRRRRAPVGLFTSALLAGDRTAAAGIAGQYLDASGSRTSLITDLFQPAQYEIGERWYEGLIGVADEHRATAIVERLAAQLEPTAATRIVGPGARCLLTSLGDERHVVGLNFVRMVLEDHGWDVLQLPPNTTRDQLLAAADAFAPSVVGISAAQMTSRAEIAVAIRDLQRSGLPVFVGGPLFNRVPGLWRDLGADGHGPDARVAALLLAKVLQS